MNLGKYTLDEYEALIKDFHGTVAPGLLIGGFMVELAQQNLPPGEFFDCVCESTKCLPDAIQLLTPCSIGNGWLKLLKIGRFAMTFFEKHTGAGVRVYLDTDKLENYPIIKDWFFKLTPKKDQDTPTLLATIKAAGTHILSIQKVSVDPSISKKKKGSAVAVCPVCNESYPAKHGEKCRICSGEITYYLHP